MRNCRHGGLRPIVLVSFLLVAMLLFTSCSNLPDDVSQTESNQTGSESVSSGGTTGPSDSAGFANQQKLQKKVNDMVSADATVEVSETFSKGTADTVNVKLMTFEPKILKDMFIKGQKTININGVTYDRSMNYMGTKIRQFQEVTENNTIVNNYLLGILYSRPFGFTLNDLVPEDESNADPSIIRVRQTKFSLTGDLPFSSRKQAVEKIQAQLGKLGIQLAPEYICYSLDHENLKKAQEEYKKIGGDVNSFAEKITDWTAAQDSYYFLFTVAINDAPTASITHGGWSGGTMVYGSPIKVIYSKEGIVYLKTGAMYKKESTKQAQQKLITAQDALNKFADAYKDIITTDKFKVTNMKMEYAATVANKSRLEFAMVPAWQLTVEKTAVNSDKTTGKTKTVVSTEQILVNAVTGEIIK